MIDVNTFIGGYPWRHVPHPEPGILAHVLEREGLAGAWVGHLPSAFYRDPAHGNHALYEALRPFRPVLRPVPTIRPGWPGLDRELDRATAEGAPGVRVYPQLGGVGAGDAALSALGRELKKRDLALVFTVRFEDARQRHPLDVAGDLSAAHVREFVRDGSGATVVVTAASREFMEEVHWGLTPDERSTVYWDISWLWGPPSDELSHLFRSVGADRFVFGSMWPLRLVQAPVANLQLLEPDVASMTLVDSDTLGRPHLPA
jgi:hypothetical protein